MKGHQDWLCRVFNLLSSKFLKPAKLQPTAHPSNVVAPHRWSSPKHLPIFFTSLESEVSPRFARWKGKTKKGMINVQIICLEDQTEWLMGPLIHSTLRFNDVVQNFRLKSLKSERIHDTLSILFDFEKWSVYSSLKAIYLDLFYKHSSKIFSIKMSSMDFDLSRCLFKR